VNVREQVGTNDALTIENLQLAAKAGMMQRHPGDGLRRSRPALVLQRPRPRK
jgi:hypothetical protein